MRRVLALSLGIVLAAATAAGASVWRAEPEPAPSTTALTPNAEQPSTSGRQQPAVKKQTQPSESVEPPKANVVHAGRAEAGKLEKVDSRISYLDSDRRAEFRYPGAEYVKVHFSHLVLLPGDFLTVGDRAGREVHRVEADVLGTVLSGGRWAMSVTGDTAVVELHAADQGLLGLVRETVGQLGVAIDKVARGYTRAERVAASEASRAAKRNGREESICGRDDKADAICYKSVEPVVYRKSKAVARLLINGVELCTAFRVGPQNRLLTNKHCISNAADAADTEVWFNYMCAECGGWEVFRPTKVWADQLLASDGVLDYSLFTVTDFEQVAKFGYLELDVRRAVANEELYIPQHPTGAPTMIAMTSDRDRAGNCAVEDPLYYGYERDTDISYHCDTEGGSSGSPVISRTTNKVLALHHFGGCPNSGVRMELIHADLARLL